MSHSPRHRRGHGIVTRHSSWFSRFARKAACYAGKPVTFGCSVALIVAWAASGPLFGFTDTWQLVINTTTTIVTFLMVFLIQNSQNRDSEALQIKLDELIHKLDTADNALLDLEELEEDELNEIRQRYLDAAKKAREIADKKAASRKSK
ncbi:low affinity iron permease family protein [Oleiharenicola lentus]|uniref:low affinity iron permease family protein n=1 Tax=Oleiharenicola lentus TaxID=2508720 RepID=UPI003F675B22